MGDPYTSPDLPHFNLLYSLYRNPNIMRRQPHPTPIQKHRALPPERITAHRIGPETQAEILLTAVGVPVPPFAPIKTSFISRMYSAQIPNQALHSDNLVGALNRELGNHTFSADDYFIKKLFPSSLLPSGMPFGDAVFEELSKAHDNETRIWNKKKQRFCVTPSKLNEKELANWLNSIGTALGNAFDQKPLRLWSNISCNTPPIGSPIARKPDLVLLNKEHHDEMQNPNRQLDWAFIRAIAEVTNSSEISKRMTDSLDSKAYLMFLCQYNRRFVVALSFTSATNGSFRLTVTDREGQVLWTVDLNVRSKERAELFLRILFVLMFGSDSDIGLDPNIEIDQNTGKCVAITVEEKRFVVEKLIYSLDSVVGRGTRVWIVTYGGIRYTLKDCWIQHERVGSEISKLEKIGLDKALTGRVPTLFCGGDVKINGEVDSTKRYRSGLPLWNTKWQRTHRQLVCTPIGKPLSEYRSKKEFINVICSIISSASLCSQRVW
jgi:hypothetical protein